MNLESRFWAGTEEALAAYVQVLKHRAERGNAPPGAQANYGESAQAVAETPPVPRLFSQVGNVGVIQIAGPLVNSDSPWNKYDGVTGYGEIRNAMIHAANEPTVGAIVLDIGSGGGSVSGVADTSDLITRIDAQIKPVHTYSDGMIASAAYWLGSSARTVDIGKLTEAGSIGIVMVHSENTKMMADIGMTFTVMRAGEFKALGNPFEKLSEPAKAEFQSQLDQMYGMFAGHVADARGVSYAVADQTMGQGRVFIGSKAVDAGLADSVTSFDAVVSRAQAGIDLKKSAPQYGTNSLKGPVVKTALTEQQIAAMAEAGTVPVSAVAALATPETEAARLAAAAPAPVAAEPAAPAVAAPVTDLNAFLKTSLSEAQASITDLTIQLRDAKSASASMAASHGAFRAIAVASVDRLKIALGGSAGGADALSDESLLAEHASSRAQFESKFKAGGVAAVSSSASAQDQAVAVDPVRQARIAATRIAK